MPLGSELRTNSVIENAIEAIVQEVAQRSRQLTGVRPPIAEQRASFAEMLNKVARDRGRALVLPAVSSGVGNGALVELADGSVKWDMICGIGVHFFGHSHPELIRAALRGAIDDTVKHGNLQSGTTAFEFTGKLLSLAGRNSRLRHAFVCSSGTMANESAIKICYQKHAPASRVIAFEHCFMGRSVTMSNIGDSAAARVGIPLSTQVDYMPFYSDAAVDAAGGETKLIDQACARLQQYIERYPGMHACFIFELVQGEGGFNKGKMEFFQALMKMCKANKIAVWDDEIQSFGRTPNMFAYDTYQVGEYVDVMCVGKLTQACAVMFSEDYNPKPGLLSSTFTGATVDFTVGMRILDLLDQGDYYGENGTIVKHFQAFREHTGALMVKHPAWFPAVPGIHDLIDGIGGMMRFTPFGGDKDKVLAAMHACFDEGVILFYCGHGPYHLRLLPPLGVMRFEDWPDVFAHIERGLARVAG
ncbi:MAG TPA: aminotransferase class III-fold pyridoxal phosphate-dependent enzyme [Haliangium sp.]|nr:aminotransferase class III-fold pyridoxal phosphate-dependent enzyme [Haliangium sp.]